MPLVTKPLTQQRNLSRSRIALINEIIHGRKPHRDRPEQVPQHDASPGV